MLLISCSEADRTSTVIEVELTSTMANSPARGCAKVLDALVRAERKVFTRPAPKSAKAQVKSLLTRAKGSTKALAERLGVSRRTVERYWSEKPPRRQHRTAAAPVRRTRPARVLGYRAQDRGGRGLPQGLAPDHDLALLLVLLVLPAVQHALLHSVLGVLESDDIRVRSAHSMTLLG